MHRQTVLVVIITMLSFYMGYSQDKPSGFASVSGKGLKTTTGGEGGNGVIVTSFSDLKKYAKDKKPYIILIKGTIKAPSKGDQIDVGSNKTIAGLGDDAVLDEIKLRCMYVSNIIIRNITIKDSYVEGDYDGKTQDYDAIQADGTHHLWIDHCHFTHCGDGLIDLRHVCDYVTISWVELSNHNKAFGIGWTEETDYRITIHHTYFNNTRTRNPSFDMGYGHLYNNYVTGSQTYGNWARGKAVLIIENSVFEKVKNPVQVDSEAKCYINGLKFSGCSGTMKGNVNKPPYDLSKYYTYKLDPTDQVKSIVTKGVGPQKAIGEQYDGVTKRIKRQSGSIGTSFLSVMSKGAKTLQIRAACPGEFFIKVSTLNGRIIEKFIGHTSININYDIPSNGIFSISVTDAQNNSINKSVLIAHF